MTANDLPQDFCLEQPDRAVIHSFTAAKKDANGRNTKLWQVLVPSTWPHTMRAVQHQVFYTWDRAQYTADELNTTARTAKACNMTLGAYLAHIRAQPESNAELRQNMADLADDEPEPVIVQTKAGPQLAWPDMLAAGQQLAMF